ncbi:hypothetical protein COOONC_14562 [Cooperia oncophora]
MTTMLLFSMSHQPATMYQNTTKFSPYPVKKRTTVGGHRVASTVIKLPSFRVTDCTASLADSVLSELATKTRAAFRRAVAIPLWDGDGPSSSGRIAPGTVLMCAPMVPKGSHVALFFGLFFLFNIHSSFQSSRLPWPYQGATVSGRRSSVLQKLCNYSESTMIHNCCSIRNDLVKN